MTSLLLAVVTAAAMMRGHDLTVGSASYYDKGPTDGTMEYRVSVGDITPKHLKHTDVFIAVPDCMQVGTTGWISIDGSDWLRYAVMDCAGHQETADWMHENNILVELDYYTSERFAPERGHTPVRVLRKG